MLLPLFTALTWAQQQMTITGTITDTENYPVIGATITVKGTTAGTVSDFNGNYTITANQGNVLEFSYVGMQKQEITVGTSTTINIKL
ncbi:MAG: carboxypeptidase-like regulatory domain-containing protein, partial [Tannerellaceae bacterium]|nr:carboxypeptidase-like regulatory domain-containing protein [Tannerellaceae bacterium]